MAPGLVVSGCLEWLGHRTGSQVLPVPLGRCGRHGPLLEWNAEGTSSPLSADVCLLQGKRHRESEDSKSSRRPSNRSPTSAEKRMSFESVSSLPEVSSQPMRGSSAVQGTWSLDLQVYMQVF